ncbi:Dinucleoside triphosphate hydrolase [Ophidiomyces ophidiicola]|nr:Dinucleoside triphosphate hydrolase [Ophidiomyces ophidiicola]KAI1915835.1 Dinucleoside triphosphate hydrolase [Ophidiomyces ophidiicola]KAI1926617.1 Dinucleoside triphosphate hydrolase [Ophidiomyces ophidiicola]KAI1963729.1 Dinucleoside triphosphate hydrolase [Ophidiomyces ophidiicola]KAI2011776.1 Dinucleoside triphosphate hydrolase [Ophidiomyces ophidiicola]
MALVPKPVYFGPFLVTSQLTTEPHQVFFTTSLSFALVNLKPLLPGHVLVSPIRNVPRVSDLTVEETADLFLTVRRVGRMVERVFKASSLNIAIQDGIDAGQSVPHVHAHIVPRHKADLDHKGGSDAIYGMLDGDEGDIARFLWERMERRNHRKFPAVDNESRMPRSDEEMKEEAERLAEEMEKEALD